MKNEYTAKLILTELFAAGVTKAEVKKIAGEYRVQVYSVADVFKTEAVAAKMKADLGIEVYAAF